MNYQQFWQIIDSARVAANGDPVKHLTLLHDHLAKMHVKEVRSFYGIWLEKFEKSNLWSIWAAAHMLAEEGCPEDGFDDFRGWVISKGETAFEAALIDPDSLADVYDPSKDGDGQVEGFNYVPYEIIEEMGGSYSDVQEQSTVTVEPRGEPFDPDDMADLKHRFPKLAKKRFRA